MWLAADVLVWLCGFRGLVLLFCCISGCVGGLLFVGVVGIWVGRGFLACWFSCGLMEYRFSCVSGWFGQVC